MEFFFQIIEESIKEKEKVMMHIVGPQMVARWACFVQSLNWEAREESVLINIINVSQV